MLLGLQEVKLDRLCKNGVLKRTGTWRCRSATLIYSRFWCGIL